MYVGGVFRLLTLLLVLLVPRLAVAHDLWLLPPDVAAVVGKPVEIRATQGMDFPGDDRAPKVERFARAVVIDPDGRTAPMKRKKPRGPAGILEFVPKREGVHVVAVDTAAKSIRLEADDFNHYLVADGMPHVFVARHDDGELAKDAVEQYQKTVKLIVRVGRADPAAKIPRTKQRLEIVPLESPFGLAAGGVLPIRVVLDGTPLAGARVGFDRPHDGPEPAGTVRTDNRGEALVPIAATGPMALRLTHMTRPKKRDYEWSSVWTTVTFRVPDGPAESSREAIDRVTVVHGGPGPFAMAGYRIGLDALSRLGHERGTRKLEVLHHSPDQVQWSCILDGVQAATGASPGKMNLARASAKDTFTVVVDRGSKRTLRYRLKKAFVKRYLNQPREKGRAAAHAIASLPAKDIFTVE